MCNNGIIIQDNHYDFNYQEYRTLAEERTVLPGDELIVECDYETVKNDTFVFVRNLLGEIRSA